MKKHWLEVIAGTIGAVAVAATILLASCQRGEDTCKQYVDQGTCVFSGHCTWRTQYDQDGIAKEACSPK